MKILSVRSAADASASAMSAMSKGIRLRVAMFMMRKQERARIKSRPAHAAPAGSIFNRRILLLVVNGHSAQLLAICTFVRFRDCAALAVSRHDHFAIADVLAVFLHHVGESMRVHFRVGTRVVHVATLSAIVFPV